MQRPYTAQCAADATLSVRTSLPSFIERVCVYLYVTVLYTLYYDRIQDGFLPVTRTAPAAQWLQMSKTCQK